MLKCENRVIFAARTAKSEEKEEERKKTRDEYNNFHRKIMKRKMMKK